MPHPSDGELHAYLDGALEHLGEGRAEEVREHLRTCEACRSRLAEERAVLERSREVLAGGSPAEVEAPPLEELRERARIREERAAAEAERGWRTMPRTQALAWAATVILALGLGWMVRDLGLVRSPAPAPSAESGAVEETGAPAAGPAARGALDPTGGADAATVGEAGPGGVEGGAPPAPAAELSDAAEEARAGEEARPGEGASVAQGEAPVAEERRPLPADETTSPARERTAAAEDRPIRSPEPALEVTETAPGGAVVGRVVDESSLEPLRGAQVVLEDSAGVRHAGTLTQADGRFLIRPDSTGTYRAIVDLIGYASTRTDFFELSPDDTVTREIRAPATAVALDEITVSAFAEEEEPAEGAAGREVAGAAARAEMERGGGGTPVPGASLLVPGLPVLSVESRRSPEGLLILQELASRDTLRLRYVYPGALATSATTGEVPRPAAPTRAADAVVTDLESPAFLRRLGLEAWQEVPPGWSQVVVRRGAGVLLARAPLPEGELRALLARRP